MSYRGSWREKFNIQRVSVGKRKIDWKITFEEWLQWWENTGHLHERGCRKDQYVMARYGDDGPYELGNIYCCLSGENVSFSRKGKPNPQTEEHIRKGAATRKGMPSKKKGIPLSQETRDRISEALRGRVFTEEHKSNMRKPKSKRR